jgi:hypothetical protein
MKVIVIRQPWAWVILHGSKDIENRTWATRHRGTLLIQASASRPTKRKLEEARLFARKRGVELPEDFELGGIVGMVQLEDCVTSSRSKWFQGPVGWVLSRPKKLKFIPLKGRLGLFDAPQEIIRNLVGPRGGEVR